MGCLKAFGICCNFLDVPYTENLAQLCQICGNEDSGRGLPSYTMGKNFEFFVVTVNVLRGFFFIVSDPICCMHIMVSLGMC